MDPRTGAGLLWLLSAAPLATAAVGYLVAVALIRRRGGWWPARRSVSWCAGLATASAALVAPPGTAGDDAFLAHMGGHLLLGMAAPLLLALAAPVTVALRVLPGVPARRLSGLLKSWPLRILTHPVTAATLNAGTLWLLYTTPLYQRMDEHGWLHVLIHVHMAASGYLFTAAIVGIDPAPHRPGVRSRAVVLIVFLAAHDILAKHLFAHPPAGVQPSQARDGAQLMYYGGDLIDLVLITVFCWQWYAVTAPGRRSRISRERPRPRLAWRLPAGE